MAAALCVGYGGLNMRVIAGKFRSRRLKSPRGLALRPTSDRLRETLFNILGTAVEGSTFVDVYAGTGAVGIEALSRGAAQVVFIEKHRAGVGLIRENLSALGAGSETEVLAMDAVRGLDWVASRGIKANFIFLDPPYDATDEYARALEALGSGRMLAPAAMVIVESHAARGKRTPLPESAGALHVTRTLVQGDAVLTFYA